MLESWLLILWLVLPGQGATTETINGFETKRACTDYGTRYKSVEIRRQVEFRCQLSKDSEELPVVNAKSRGARMVAQSLLGEIAAWLTANFDLPASPEEPRIEFAPPLKIAAMRYKGMLPLSWREDSIRDPATQTLGLRDVVAVYRDDSRTIYLNEHWTGATPAEVSVLVHEMVHHIQNVARLKYDCPAAREKPAYLAQNEWLKRHGSDLESEFEVDMMTLLVRTSCMD
jgi:hypothetical protein